MHVSRWQYFLQAVFMVCTQGTAVVMVRTQGYASRLVKAFNAPVFRLIWCVLRTHPTVFWMVDAVGMVRTQGYASRLSEALNAPYGVLDYGAYPGVCFAIGKSVQRTSFPINLVRSTNTPYDGLDYGEYPRVCFAIGKSVQRTLRDQLFTLITVGCVEKN